MTESDLRARRGTGVTSDGTRLPADTVCGLADQADGYVALLSPVGVVPRQDPPLRERGPDGRVDRP